MDRMTESGGTAAGDRASVPVVADRYRLEREVGRGGMGAVWLGKDTVLKRQVALKAIGRMPGADQPDGERVRREARVSAQLNHEHVVAVFDLVETDDQHWLVMEYLESLNLAQRIWRDGPLPPDEAAELIRASRLPLIVAGGGVAYAEANDALRTFAEVTGIPVGESQAGKGSLPYDHPQSVGAIGSTGTTAANTLAESADLVIGVGTRFADTLEQVCVEAVEGGEMTKDLAILVSKEQPFLSTEDFLAALDRRLQAKMEAW